MRAFVVRATTLVAWQRQHIPHAAALAACALAGVVSAVCVSRAVFAATIADTSGYVAGAEALYERQLFRPDPLSLLPAINESTATLEPLGYRHGVTPGTTVPVYPLGLGYVMASVRGLGPEAVYVIAPITFGLLVLTAFAVASGIGGSAAGLVAAIAVAGNPAAIYTVVLAMSDVPATTCWMAAWYFARRGSIGAAVTAGLIAALGITIRPNLAPLALVPALAMLSAAQGRRQRAWRPLAAFCATVAIGPLLVFWSQAALYGSPVESGYPAADSFFRLAHAAVNLRTYPRLLLDTLGWGLPTMAIVGLLLYPHASTASRRAAVEALGFIVINALLYVWYLPYDHWPFVRFFLPASTAFAVGASALAADGCRSWPPLRRVVLGTGLVILVLSSAWHARAFTGFALGDWLSQRRVLVMGHYLRQVLPANAVVIGHVHTGAVAHYTGRLVVRPDRLDGTALDRLILDLERHGFSPFLVIDEQLEEPQFRQVFRASTYGALDWPPRAEFVSTARIRVFDPADRARLRAGASWPIDRVH